VRVPLSAGSKAGFKEEYEPAGVENATAASASRRPRASQGGAQAKGGPRRKLDQSVKPLGQPTAGDETLTVPVDRKRLSWTATPAPRVGCTLRPTLRSSLNTPSVRYAKQHSYPIAFFLARDLH